MKNQNTQDIYAFFPIWEKDKREKVVREIADVINRNSIENHSNTPDFILAEHAVKALESFAATSTWREKWLGNQEKKHEISDDITEKDAIIKDDILKTLYQDKMLKTVDIKNENREGKWIWVLYINGKDKMQTETDSIKDWKFLRAK